MTAEHPQYLSGQCGYISEFPLVERWLNGSGMVSDVHFAACGRDKGHKGDHYFGYFPIPEDRRPKDMREYYVYSDQQNELRNRVHMRSLWDEQECPHFNRTVNVCDNVEHYARP